MPYLYVRGTFIATNKLDTVSALIFATILCTVLFAAMVTADGNPLAESCGQVCGQTCDIIKQVFSVFSVFLGPFVNTGFALCTQGCSFVCGIFG
ncbi:hypothetical protein PoB_002979700 [Plakobranchus ocellatus]|uniref:Uncharacterized protein n=1 Tax=Plakobranchus ocellatus TaxID=259542 RepID=A0AAV4A7P1_9GAST|nr:hypothetical protein PoB_002979700 [Plakobranchus ocellatus]